MKKALENEAVVADGLAGAFPRGWLQLRRGKILASEDLRLLILHMLLEGPRHGYDVIKALRQHSSGVYAPSPGMVYPVFASLERLNFANSETDGNKKLFTITREGKRFLNSNQDRAIAVLLDLKRYGLKVAHFERGAAQEETEVETWGGGPGAQNSKAWRQMKSDYIEIRQELKLALFDKMDSALEEKQRVLSILRNALDEIRGIR